MLNLVIFGAPGSGKGTQSEKIIERYGLHHISTGEVLRDHIARGTELGKVADSYISKGQLIPDSLMIEVLEDVLDRIGQATDLSGVIYDGFPRTVEQAEAFAEMLGRRGQSLHAVVGLEVDEDLLMDRMLRRGRLTGRADDNAETIGKRLKVYHSQTSPLRDYYISRGLYLAIDGNGTPDEIFGLISQSLDASGAARKSQA